MPNPDAMKCEERKSWVDDQVLVTQAAGSTVFWLVLHSSEIRYKTSWIPGSRWRFYMSKQDCHASELRCKFEKESRKTHTGLSLLLFHHDNHGKRSISFWVPCTTCLICSQSWCLFPLSPTAIIIILAFIQDKRRKGRHSSSRLTAFGLALLSKQ